MWHEFHDWLRRFGSSPQHRQASSSRPRGRFESLEARSMLSASYGDVEPYAASASYDVVRSYGEITHYENFASYGDIETLRSEFRLEERPAIHVVAIVMVSEVPPPLAVRFFANTNAAAGDAPWENMAWRGPRPGGTGPLAIKGDTWEPPLAIKGQAPDGTVADDAGAADIGGTLGSGNAGGGSATTGLSDNLPPGGGNKFANFLADNNRGQTFLSIVGERGHYQPPLPPASMANYLSAVSGGATTNDALTSPLGRTASLRDAAFEDSADDALLLASDQATSGEERDRNDLGNEQDADARDSDDENDDANSLFDETTAVALNALARERRAIEAVLEALDDIEITHEESSAAESTTYQHRDSPRELALEDWRFDFGRAVVAAPAYDTEGGMVLLENSGDANSNAYDLTAAFVAELTPSGGDSNRVEAVLGMYQAMDVGGSDLNATATAEQSIAKPDAKAPASVSAENAPVKKSERPS